MALPTNDIAWPPTELNTITRTLAEWSAWYEGTPEGLQKVYNPTQAAAKYGSRPSQSSGGVVGVLARFWWGRPINRTSGLQRVDQLHIPLAADICQASADLLYAEPPQITIDDDATQKELNRLLDDGLHVILASGAEIGAALGGRYHRVTWDKVTKDRPFLTTIDADAAWPEFRWGQLVAVTFWYTLTVKGQEVWRHLERHELNQDGDGLIIHGLYMGTPNKLGRPLPLDNHPSTEPLTTLVDEAGAILEGRTKGLLVEYVPNQRPSRRWRNDPVGRELGRSDLDGVEATMDALDEAYSSWMRDLRLAKSRIFMPEYMMESGEPGGGAFADLDREVYVPVNSAAPEDADAKITLNQFTIRVTEHQQTCQELTNVILRSAGYSAQTFGESSGAGETTATEVRSRERRSYLTRDRKIRLERPAVARIIHKMLLTSQSVFNITVNVEEPANVVFGDAIQEGGLQLSQTTQALDTARAASVDTKVRMNHPDWDETRIITEVEAIKAEQNIGNPAVDPFGFQG